MIVTLAGGVGAARMLAGLQLAFPPGELAAIVNTADDLTLHGLHISPDLDTVVYTLAGAINPETGWGLAGETWQAMDSLARYRGITWFNLGDRDLGTHLYRTQRLGEDAPLHQICDEIARAWGLELTIMPMTDDEVRTRVTVAGEGEIGFQEYFVERAHSVPVESVRFAGADRATPAPGVLDAIASAAAIVIAPSNPVVSIGPILAVPGVREALGRRRAQVAAVSPIIGGRALKGPADRLLEELGHESSVVGVARLYADVAATLVIDSIDAERADEITATGMTPVVTDTVMSSPEIAAALARTVVGATGA
ncbi:MAG: 2-phospho-L-lactate transferase [Acidimicrobiia bacterium]|nr:2-phospho-L-lactate transferase [Acidimicrobiia bacterium]